MIQFYETKMGNKFFCSDIPRIASALVSIANQLERLNNNLEKGERNLWAVDIQWDTDGEEVDLPKDVKMPEDFNHYKDVADYLSDTYGFCVVSCGVEHR